MQSINEKKIVIFHQNSVQYATNPAGSRGFQGVRRKFPKNFYFLNKKNRKELDFDMLLELSVICCTVIEKMPKKYFNNSIITQF